MGSYGFLLGENLLYFSRSGSALSRLSSRSFFCHSSSRIFQDRNQSSKSQIAVRIPTWYLLFSAQTRARAISYITGAGQSSQRTRSLLHYVLTNNTDRQPSGTLLVTPWAISRVLKHRGMAESISLDGVCTGSGIGAVGVKHGGSRMRTCALLKRRAVITQ